MKALKGKTLMSLIYAMCLSIPLLSILSRVIYVQSNKNAYQSYSGASYEKQFLDTNDVPLYEVYYTFSNDVSYLNTNYKEMTWTNVEYVSGNLLESEKNTITSNLTINFWNDINYGGNFCNWNGLANNLNAQSKQFTIKGNIVATNSYVSLEGLNTQLVYRYPNIGSTLDNVFDYSVSKLVDENNFGQLNFFSWFENMLLTDAQQNMLYVRFVNWYLNYALLVSLMQILFLCLMWFVNFSRKLLDRGMNYDW